MIRGAQQSLEYESTAARFYYTVTDDKGLRQKPDADPTVTLYDPDGDEIASGSALSKAAVDFSDHDLTNLDSVLEFATAGSEGDLWRLIVSGTSASGVVTYEDANLKVAVILFEDGVSTVTNFETAVGLMTYLAVKTAGTGANVLSAGSDELGPVYLSRGPTMSMVAVSDRGFLAYDGQTAEFNLGAVLTDGTSGATAIIVADRKSGATGVLELAHIDGVFGNNNAITDDGDTPGAAVVNGTAYTADYYLEEDISDTEVWEVATGYIAVIEYDISGRGYKRNLYFSVGYSPMVSPIVNTSDIDEMRSHWIQERPDTWVDWSPAIKKAHADLVRRIHSMGDESEEYVRREDEMWLISFAWTCAEIGRACGFDAEVQERLDKEAEAAWRGRGMLTSNTDEDPELEETRKPRMGSEFLR